MTKGVENIGRRDIAWSYIATIFMIGAGALLFPFILNKMSAETVGIWNIFQTITLLVLMLDFGFRPSFARNISYILSGAKHLFREGIETVPNGTSDIDFSLLKGTLTAMRRFYRWLALGAFAVLASVGSVYFVSILNKYSGDRQDALIAWILVIVINCYNLYTLYYDALLLGKGYVKRSQQITILGQSIYLSVAIILIYCGLGLTAIVAAQLLSTVCRRILTYRVFFTPDMRQALNEADEQDAKLILSAITPNAVKIGLTQLGGFCINKSAILIGSAFLSLEQIASYGITLQVMDILSRCATVYYQSITPKLAQYRTENNWNALRTNYIYNELTLISTFIVGGIAWILLGDWALGIIHSQTPFVPTAMLVAMLIFQLLEQNHATSAGFIMADNRIPFFIPSLVSGAATIILMLLFFHLPTLCSQLCIVPLSDAPSCIVHCPPSIDKTWPLILAPGIVQLAYQNWKWPSAFIKELKQHRKNI
ncbi:MAG: hypothetical protein MJZ64_06395 [Paludibacteraceae bacterium]|nr:hypothetical protein [Paludibacteraceae bacterium]